MNTVFTIIAAAIVVGAIFMLMGMAIVNYILFNRREKRRKETKKREEYYNMYLPNSISLRGDSGAEGFITCVYISDKWYIMYYYKNAYGISYSITKSFNKEGKQVGGYGRRFSRYMFENDKHDEAFSRLEYALKRDIVISVASYE